MSPLASKFGQTQLCVFHGTVHIFDPAFVMDCQLFTGVNFILRIGNHLRPDFRGSLMLAAALGH
jgi:hypothetical protein